MAFITPQLPKWKRGELGGAETGRIKVYSEQVKHPRYVRYGWQPFTRANLVNKDGLPASTFKAEAPESFVKSIDLQKMKGFPKSEKGIESGVSACYSGILSGSY